MAYLLSKAQVLDKIAEITLILEEFKHYHKTMPEDSRLCEECRILYSKKETIGNRHFCYCDYESRDF